MHCYHVPPPPPPRAPPENLLPDENPDENPEAPEDRRDVKVAIGEVEEPTVSTKVSGEKEPEDA